MEAPFFSRLVIVGGGIVRLAYGLHALLAPEAMGRRRLAPRTHGEADPRLSLRGFGGQLVVIGAGNLLTSQSVRLARPLILLNLGIDAMDLTAGGLEWRARGELDRTVAGSLAINLVGLLAFTVALALLPRRRPGRPA